MEPANKREMNRQLNESHGAFELVLSPLILGLLGFWLDSRLDTSPWLTVAAVVIGVTGAVVKLVYGYRLKMAEHDAALEGRAMTADAGVVVNRLEGPAPAEEIARDLVKRAAWLAPAVVVFGAFWGADGALSAGYALLVVAVNFALAGWMLTVAGRISFAAMAGAAMFGYLIRLGIITAAVFPVMEMSWVEKMPLGITLIVTHLGLLVWELRRLSISYAYPGLKPSLRGDALPNVPADDRPASAA